MAGRNRPLNWSPEALADLSEIWSYYANAAGSQTADNVIRAIENACRFLEDYPFAGRERDELRPSLRSIAARPYIVFYRVAKGGGDVIRVLHARRDLDSIFAGDTTV